jgi:DNA helicase-2/ATP-dependent DNA helicase PcrA
MLARLDPRPAQIDILEYTQGWMGISAVPGSGKTHTLSALAAKLLVEESLEPDQEVLVVTLVNSAVNNFSQRIDWFIQGEGLLPEIGYRVRTLHGLANDILKERPDLAGLSDRFQILDEQDVNQILNDASLNWLKSHPQFYDEYLNPDLSTSQINQVRRKFPELAASIAGDFIRIAKDQQATPKELSNKLAGFTNPPLLLQMGCDIFSDYQRALSNRSAVDFDDLIRLALVTLQTDVDFLNRLRYRWPYILEDEAQDSSRLQEEILSLMAGSRGNWVRVGDPNQAIYETFTTADPHYLIDFVENPQVKRTVLPNSGRSTQSIINLANYLVEWVKTEHPAEELRDSLFHSIIEPSPLNDPQPNPPDNPKGIYLSRLKLSPDDEISAIVKSIKSWLPDHQDQTVAILTPRNERGAEVVASLKKAGVEPVELLRSSLSTRQTADMFSTVLRFLADPASTPKLLIAYRTLRREQLQDKDTAPVVHAAASLLHRCARLEDFLAPTPEYDWLSELSTEAVPPDVLQELEYLRNLFIPWQKATILPIDQLLLTITQDLFDQPTDLALAHKLALVLEGMSRSRPEWRLPEFSEELAAVARNERKFLGFTEEDTGFDPDQHRGKVVVATIHKAKGLEWDRVYLMSVNNYDFPSLEPYDTYFSEKWFIRDQLNLEAEALSQLRGLIADNPALVGLEEGLATREARVAYAAERLRVLYVGITRARRELTITWNTGRRGDCIAAIPLLELTRYWEEQQ